MNTQLTETLKNSAQLCDKAEIFIDVLRANIKISLGTNTETTLKCLAMIHEYVAELKKNHKTLTACLTQNPNVTQH